MRTRRDASALRQGWPYLAVGTVIIGLVARNGAVTALGFAIGLAALTAALWARYSLRRVVYERILREDHGFSGEKLDAVLRITNRKPLPLPWIEVQDLLPESLVDRDTDLHAIGHPLQVALDWRTSAGAYQRVSRALELTCPARGRYEIGPATLRSGDPFGLFSDLREETRKSAVVVYPATASLPDLSLPARRPYGESKHGLRLFEDPSRVAGLRDYRPEDSMRRIDWNATARLGSLQSRVYEPSSSQHLLICLNTQTITPAWAGYIPDVLEQAISVAASLAREAYERRSSVGLLANSSVPEADRPIRIAPGRRPEQFIRLLEALAVIGPFVLGPLSVLLDKEEHRLSIGTTVAVVTGTMPADLASTLQRLRRRGHEVVVLSVSDEALSGDLDGIAVRDVSERVVRFASPLGREGELQAALSEEERT